MKEKLDERVGVIVGRFQCHELHEAHVDLIQTVQSKHNKVLVFLGLSPARVTINNPLDYEARKLMFKDKFPNISVHYIQDCESDDEWSRKLDENIKALINPNQTALLYGGRNSFINHYKGTFESKELEADRFISASDIRKTLGASVKGTSDFRAGVIWGTQNKYTIVHPTVDVAIFNEDETKILLCRKSTQQKYRFVGGFATPQSDSYEEDVRREAQEETGLEIGDIQYVGSFKVDDWRYRSEQDKIKTILFKAKVIYG